MLQGAIIRTHGETSLLAQAIGRDLKGKLSPVLYVVAIGCTFVEPWIAGALYAFVAFMWLIPDKRIEGVMRDDAA